MNKMYLIIGIVVVFSVSLPTSTLARSSTLISPTVSVMKFDDVVVDFADQNSVRVLYETLLESYAHQLSLFQLNNDLAAQIIHAAQHQLAFVYNVHRNTSNTFPVVISFNDVAPINPPTTSLSSERNSSCVKVGGVKICTKDGSDLISSQRDSVQTLTMTSDDEWSISDLSLGLGWGTTSAGGGFSFGTGYEATGTFVTPLGDYDFSAGMYGSAFSEYCWEYECDPYWSDTFYDLSLDGPGPITFSYGGFLDEGFDGGEFSVGVDLFEAASAIGSVGDFIFGD